MCHRLVPSLALLGLVAVVGCTRGAGGAADSAVTADAGGAPASTLPAPTTEPAPPGAPPGSAADTTPADTPATGTTAPTSGGTSRAGGLATLTEIRTAPRAQEPYERVVFQFGAGPLPRYEIAYAEPPAQQCGSGADVPVAGSAMLRVRLRGTQAHVQSGGAMRPTLVDRDRRPDQPLLKQLTLVCDFEGEVDVVLGVAARLPYRVLELDMPTRLVIDLLQPTPGAAPR